MAQVSERDRIRKHLLARLEGREPFWADPEIMQLIDMIINKEIEERLEHMR